MPFLLVMILCCKLISYCLVRGAPIAEDVPHDPVVALHGEEAKGAVVGLYLPMIMIELKCAQLNRLTDTRSPRDE